MRLLSPHCLLYVDIILTYSCVLHQRGSSSVYDMSASISFIIPCYNEQDRLATTLQHIADFLAKKTCVALKEIIIVDDGSSDRTAAIAQEWQSRLPIHLVRFQRNTGKGAALRAGVLHASGMLILLYDADAATPICELDRLFEEMKRSHADIVIGSRVRPSPLRPVEMAWHRQFIGTVYRLLTWPLIPGIDDAACGCKLFRGDVAKKIFSKQRVNRFAYDIEILSLALQNGYTIVTVPVRWRAVPLSKVRIVRDGMEMLMQVFLLYVRRLFHFFSSL